MHCVVKLNPTLLGPAEARRILHDVLGYATIAIPDAAFDEGPDAGTRRRSSSGRLERHVAQRLGRGLGVKFSNTLVVENHGDFLPASREASCTCRGRRCTCWR